MQPPERAWDLRAAILTAVFFGFVAVGIAHHEMWRDEWQAWMLARDSRSLFELLGNLRHEGHPPGWHFVLFLISRVTRDPVAMQGAHLAIATTSIYVMARFAPMPWLYKVLVAFSYFLAYEYAVIARQYALGVLALFAFCALVPVRQRHPVPVFLTLLLLASTSAYGIILAMAAGGALLLEERLRTQANERRAVRSPWIRSRKGRIAVAVWLAGMAVIALTIRPPDGFRDSLRGDGDLSRWSLAQSYSTIAKGYLPLPDLSALHIWNSHVLTTDTRSALAFALGLSLLLTLGAVLLFLKKPAVLFFYLAGTAGLLVFHHIVFPGLIRHYGYLFLLFVACLWLASLPLHEWRIPSWMERWTGPRSRLAAPFLLAVLTAQVVSAGVLYTTDIQGHFSAAPAVADFIGSHDLGHLPLAASPATPASSVAGLLDRPIHYLAIGAPGTFVDWSQYPRNRDLAPSMNLIRPFLDATEGEALLLLGDVFEGWDPDLEVREVARFPAGAEQREGFVLYRVAKRLP